MARWLNLFERREENREDSVSVVRRFYSRVNVRLIPSSSDEPVSYLFDSSPGVFGPALLHSKQGGDSFL